MLSRVVAIVSGGSSGLGAATAACLVRNGGRVIVADLGHQKEAFLKMAAKATSDNVMVMNDDGSILASTTGGGSIETPSPVLGFSDTDVLNTDQISRALDMAESVFGEPVNAAINCAGVCPARKTLSTKGDKTLVHSLDEFSLALQVNAIGTFNMSRLAAERMASRDPDEDDVDDYGDGLRGCIINTASIAAYDGQIGQIAYAASKGAVVSMTLPMARDLASSGIRVMTIAPGLFQTPLLDGLPQKVKDDLGASVPCPSRLGHPDEFGQLVMTILTNKMLNGEVIRLDGAIRMPP